MHHEPMDHEFVARLLRVARNELEPGIQSDQFVYEHGNVPRFEMPIQWRSFGALLFRRNMDGHAVEPDASNVPRLVNQAGPAHVPREFADFDERWNVGSPVIVQREAGALHGDTLQQGNLEVPNFGLAVEAASQHIEG